MTEQEAIKVLKMVETHGSLTTQAKEMAIKALEEVQAYRAIGTVEEFEELLKYRAIGSVDGIKSSIECNSVLLFAYGSIGTVEEFKSLKEKSVAKMPIRKNGECYSYAKDGTKLYEIITECPTCHSIALKYSYPCRCGQILDWE